MRTKLAIILVLALAVMAIPMTSVLADSGVYVDNTSAGFKMLSPSAQKIAQIVGYGTRPAERISCYLSENSSEIAKAVWGNQQSTVLILPNKLIKIKSNWWNWIIQK